MHKFEEVCKSDKKKTLPSHSQLSITLNVKMSPQMYKKE